MKPVSPFGKPCLVTHHAATSITGLADLSRSTTETIPDPDFTGALRIHMYQGYVNPRPGFSHVPVGLGEPILAATKTIICG